MIELPVEDNEILGSLEIDVEDFQKLNPGQSLDETIKSIQLLLRASGLEYVPERYFPGSNYFVMVKIRDKKENELAKKLGTLTFHGTHDDAVRKTAEQYLLEE